MLLFAGLGMQAQQTATVRVDAQVKHQQITGFGAFVCSPQFTYNHMSSDEINRIWGSRSTLQCNIMRVIIPVGKNSWGQSLQTIKNAKEMGLIVFASPWGQPAEWKTNNSSAAKNSEGVEGRLKREYWDDYAQYLDDFVKYLRQNGVELDAISIQNEPDWPCTYDGCLWSPSEMAEFVKTYGSAISCKIITPETLAVRDDYVNALNTTDVLDEFDIYGGHQYGGIQSAYKQLGQKGKQIWMTEYLINWNENKQTTRNFDFSTDFFDFFNAINICMLGNFNAWIHYSAKRFYGLLGDGQYGTSNGTVTKRGFVMAHFSRFIKGMTRIDATFSGGSFEGSAYLSVTGDTTVVVLANTGNESVTATVDLPFYTQTGKFYTTTEAKNFNITNYTAEQETCRPVTTLPAKSVSTLLFYRSRDRQPSQMKGSMARFDRLDAQSVTKSSFGTTYQMSGKSRTFDHSNSLISSRTDATNGYVSLSNRFSKLVMHVKKLTSTLNYSSAKTTLIYVNAKGNVSSHDYGDLTFSSRENFDLVFDLSPATLSDGCIGLIGMTNNNWSSTLTFTFGDVYLANTPQYAATMTGAFVADDSYLLDYTSDAGCTSLNLQSATDLPATLPWAVTNRVVYVSEGSAVTGANIVVGNQCAQLQLTPEGGAFRPASTFTADEAQFTCTVNNLRFVMLPFAAAVPAGFKAYAVAADHNLSVLETIPAHQPVLIEGLGEATFCGSGEVKYAASSLTNELRGTYAPIPLYAGDYVLGQQGEQWGLVKLTAATTLQPFDVYAKPTNTADFQPFDIVVNGIAPVTASAVASAPVFNLMGQRVARNQKGLVIMNGRKYLKK